MVEVTEPQGQAIHNHHRIRLMPPLGSALPGATTTRRASILRLQPPATITKSEIDRIIAALDEVLRIIECNNEHCLLAHLWGDRVPETERRKPVSFAAPAQDVGDAEQPDVRVGFVLHPPEIRHVVSHFMPSLDHYGWSRGAVEGWGVGGGFGSVAGQVRRVGRYTSSFVSVGVVVQLHGEFVSGRGTVEVQFSEVMQDVVGVISGF